ncbi:hypothetical protein [Acinetobacter sp. MB5]|uniref:FimV/HubP-related protein n=1 Tax=Acinetobacter sp. MB5 TaxID=2069438 RepID=UPI000DD0C6AA|nr:hypothetical protein [Acinetobacter sp. MB5]
MTAYNKLASALILCFAAQSGYALTFNAAQVESTQGQLLYVEIPYANASDNSTIQAGLADTDDLIRMGASQQDLNGLNFFIRRTGKSSGVIVITSSQPINNKNINLVLKVQDGDGAHLQQIQKSLTGDSPKTQMARNNLVAMSTQEHALIPKQIVSEKDIALNLPESKLYTQTAPMVSTPTPVEQLAISVSAPPHLNPVTPNPSNSASVVVKSAPATTPTPIARKAQNVVQATQQPAAISTNNPQTSPHQQALKENVPKPIDATAPKAKITPQAETTKHTNYVVQHQDSLWRIAARISEQTHQPIGAVMNHIKALNEHAFIGGNINRLKAGATLNLGANDVAPPHAHPNTPTKSMNSKAGNKYSTKYRLNQAEMTLVTENANTSSGKMDENGRHMAKTSPELSSKVMTIREKTVTLQKNVVQLDLALQKKDHQIQLLNARLAQLQQQLQQQQKVKKPSHH